MRHILFRGKACADGKWVLGSLIDRFKNGVYITPLGSGESSLVKADPDTIGQFIGLSDINHKMIFEGDIVKYDNRLHKVVYENRNGCAYFGIVISELDTRGFTYSVPCKKMEVVGNIYDNPELLGGDGQVNSWIRVTDRRPTEKINPLTHDFCKVICFCHFEHDTDVRVFGYGKGHFWSTSGIMDDVVTHWMEMPKPPSKVEMNIFDKEETYTGCTVQVLTNSVTGEVSVGWQENKKE